MDPQQVVSRAEWLKSRRELLIQEKAHTKARDQLTRARQALPWVKIDKDYVFTGTAGPVTLAELFDEHSQLIVYHFMFDPEWDEGCKACSFLVEHYDRLPIHLARRDVAFVTVARAPLEKLDSFRRRMGWSSRWVSSAGCDFNRDFHVSFTDEQLADSTATYNFQDNVTHVVREAPGLSVFAKDADGQVYHTYSVYARGLEDFLTAYNFLDVVPAGRNEDDLPYGMHWLRLRDQYGDAQYQDRYSDD